MIYRQTALAALFLLFLLAAMPQTASITGTVKDNSGAVVPPAQITARNASTNASRSTQTSESGTYWMTSLVPGIYDVLIEKPGFKAVEYSRVEITVDQVQNLDATLTPSSLTEKVIVTRELLSPVDLSDAQRPPSRSRWNNALSTLQ